MSADQKSAKNLTRLEILERLQAAISEARPHVREDTVFYLLKVQRELCLDLWTVKAALFDAARRRS